MELPSHLARATLTEITWDKQQNVQVVDKGVKLVVQFNPESLKLAYSNQRAGNDQRGGAATQHVGEGTTKLSFDLWFDVNAPSPSAVNADDVRKLTQQVVYFIRPKETDDKKNVLAPGVRFEWGTFKFEGTVDSLNETLELFSDDGKPLRAQIAVSLTKQDIVLNLKTRGATVPGRPAAPPGTAALQAAVQGATVQAMAAARGIDDWQSVAMQNGIEQPRLPGIGTALRFG